MCGGPDDRSIGRIAGAAVVAVGLVVSASLYHLPGDRRGVVLGEEDHGSLSTLPDRLGAVAATQLIDLTTTQLPTLAHLADILQHNFPSVRAEVFLSAVEKHGLPQIVRTLEVLASAGFAMPVSALLFNGGGGGGGAVPTGSPIGPMDLELLWQYLMQQLPAAMIQGLTDIVAAFIPASAGAAQIQHAVQVLSVAAPPAPPAPAAPPVAPSSVPPPPPPPPSPSAVAPPPPPTPPPPPPPPVVVAPPPVEVPAPPTVEISTPAPPPVTVEVTTDAPVPEADGNTGTDDIGNTGTGDDSGSGENSSDSGQGDGSGTQGGGDSGSGTSHSSDTGSDGGQGSGGASGPDNGPSGGGTSGDSGSGGG